ncbi:MAG: hypothetical protein GF317_07530 [Candidatus Lokiarchaeota archaeon]|nr:hypothetical protein [Candidatus Lokiarchaeota archaeon]MBD3199560.1 hypothetical protein [Candidatus Lokiarchaeota archaeon]
MNDIDYCPKCGSQFDSEQIECTKCNFNLEVNDSKKLLVATPIRLDQANNVPPAVKLEPKYAKPLPRLIAFIIDCFIIIVAISFVNLIINFGLFISNPFDLYFSLNNLFASSLIAWGVGFLYALIMESFNDGKTVGKIVMNLKTVDEDTLTKAKPFQYAINNLVKFSVLVILDFIIGVLISAGDVKNRYRLLQNTSDTIVIKD